MYNIFSKSGQLLGCMDGDHMRFDMWQPNAFIRLCADPAKPHEFTLNENPVASLELQTVVLFRSEMIYRKRGRADSRHAYLILEEGPDDLWDRPGWVKFEGWRR